MFLQVQSSVWIIFIPDQVVAAVMVHKRVHVPPLVKLYVFHISWDLIVDVHCVVISP